MIIYKPVKISWLIHGVDGYGFGDDKILYNLKTCRIKKQVYNNGSIGYKFGDKFYSLTKLRSMLYKPKTIYMPF